MAGAPPLGNPARRLHTPEEEQAIADFLKNNPCFYDKSHQDFKNKPKKDGLLEHKIHTPFYIAEQYKFLDWKRPSRLERYALGES